MSRDRIDKVAALPAEQRAQITALLDELSQPLTAREIERLLRGADIGSKEAKRLAGVLKGWAIVVMVPLDESADGAA